MIKSKIFLGCIVVESFLLLCLYLHGLTLSTAYRNTRLPDNMAIVNHLGLTDFAVWTEARYTRHPSQTDFFSAFQDFPGSPDHFPAGSIIAPVHISNGVGQ